MASRSPFPFVTPFSSDFVDLGGRARRTPSGALVGVLFLLASTLGAGAGFAREDVSSRPLKDSAASTTYANPQDKRRAELRRALISGADLHRASTPEPRRLSPEQRETLQQELREAMRNANRPRSVTER